MDNKPSRKILKSPVAKRRSRLVPKDQKVTLERVLGLTASNNASMACDPNTGTVAYPAGCVVVLYNIKKNKQSHIFNVSKKTLTSVAFSGDGKHLITGESGHQPAVRVWDAAEKVQVAEFHGHKFGISCVAFSPNLKYIVSIGTQHDMQVNVWNWKTGSKVASNKVSSKVSSVAFSADGSYFVTVGMRHVKFWYLESSKSKVNETVPLNGRNGILGDHRNNYFCDVAMGTGKQLSKTFCVTRGGFLCQFNEKRQMDKWLELRTTCANAVSAGDDYIVVGCANGVVRVFDTNTLHYVATLPRPHNLGVDIAAAVSPSQLHCSKTDDLKYPDTVAVQYDVEHRKVTCIYNDHSLYVWDIHDLKKIGKAWSFLFHSSSVYGIEVYPLLGTGQKSVLPPHSFFTCSSDDTIRIWNLDPHMAETDTYKSNIYSHELLKVMYMDPSLASLCDQDYNPSGATDKTDTNYDDKNGIRSIKVSPDGQHLASGDRQGNVRIHELRLLKEIRQIEAHESEVLSLEYSHWKNGPKLLASSSRDRLVHVFDMEQQYGLLQTLSDHSSAISAVRFTESDDQFKMLSCGADKSILFRNLQQEPEFQFVLGNHLVEKMTLYDMAVEPSQKFAAIACQDRNVRVYNIKTGKKKKEYKGALADDGTLLKLKLDPSGSYAATSCSDKNLCILDFYTGELIATMSGHSEIATDVRFMNDLKHIITVSGDGCIFIWRLPKDMTAQMQARLKEMGQPTPPQMVNGGDIRMDPSAMSLAKQLRDEVDAAAPMPQDREFFSPQRALREMYPDMSPYREGSAQGPQEGEGSSPDYRFSIGQLPSWAKKQMDTGFSGKSQAEDTGGNTAPKNRWAERAEGKEVIMKQQDGKAVDLQLATDKRRFTYEADAIATDTQDLRRETMVLNRPSSIPKNMPVILGSTADEEEEDEDFLPTSSTTFVKQEADKGSIIWDELYNFDNDESESAENTEIIYYPPSESDGSDTLPSSYQVFDTGFTMDRTSRPNKQSMNSSQTDPDSETTDPVSVEDMEDDEESIHSAPSTPLDDPTPKSKYREKFLKEAYENLSFTPNVANDMFEKKLDSMEQEMAASQPAGLVNPRHSLSARFLSKSQQANIRNMGVYGTIQRQDNWFDSVQRRKDDMARNLDESRKMLEKMGWKQESPETEGEDPFSAPAAQPKSPQSPDLHFTPSKDSLPEYEDEERTPTNFSEELKHMPEPPPSPRTPKSLRRCWSTLELPKTPIPEESGRKSASARKKPLGRSGNQPVLICVQPVSNRVASVSGSVSRIPSPQAYSPKHTRRKINPRASSVESSMRKDSTPVARKAQVAMVRPRSLLLDKEEAKTGLYKKKTSTSTARSADARSSNARLSTPNLNKPEPPKEKRRASAGSNLNKSKSNSMHSLVVENSPSSSGSGKKEGTKPRSKWSTTSNMASFASVPDLFNLDKAPFSFPGSGDSVEPKNSKADVPLKSDSDKTKSKSVKSTDTTPPARRSVSTSRLSAMNRANSIEEKKESNSGFVRKVGASVSSKKTAVSKNRGDKDRDLMPPPPTTNFRKSQETKFMKRAQAQPNRRKTTSDLTFEQAKDILKGNSGILSNVKQKERRSSSSSPPAERSKLDADSKPINNDDIGLITDPNVLSVASEIELTAAELRRKSAPGSALEASPNDLPERDIPAEKDIPNTQRASTAESNTNSAINISVSPLKKGPVPGNKSAQNESLAQIDLDKDEDACPSPSVKDRIARLNQQVVEKDVRGSSPFRDRSHSPAVDQDSPRVSSNATNISSNTATKSSTTTTNSYSSPYVPTSQSDSSVTMATTPIDGSPGCKHSKLPNQSPIPFDPNNEINGKSVDTLKRSPNIHGGHMTRVDDAALVLSQESDGLPNQLSTSYHSNTSPQSVADTGIGSDTDLDTMSASQTSQCSVFSRDSADPVQALQTTVDQLQTLTDTAFHLYKQLQSRQDTAAVQAQQMFVRCVGTVNSRCQNLNIPTGGHSNGGETPTMSTNEHNKLLDMVRKLASMSDKANSMASEMASMSDEVNKLASLSGDNVKNTP